VKTSKNVLVQRGECYMKVSMMRKVTILPDGDGHRSIGRNPKEKRETGKLSRVKATLGLTFTLVLLVSKTSSEGLAESHKSVDIHWKYNRADSQGLAATISYASRVLIFEEQKKHDNHSKIISSNRNDDFLVNYFIYLNLMS